MEETKQELINLCSYYIKNKQTLLDVYKHEDFIVSYREFMDKMSRYIDEEEFWEDLPMDIRITDLDLRCQVHDTYPPPPS
jgi:hypothetical protein